MLCTIIVYTIGKWIVEKGQEMTRPFLPQVYFQIGLSKHLHTKSSIIFHGMKAAFRGYQMKIYFEKIKTGINCMIFLIIVENWL